ncbi:MAG: response regulator transcription factor [Clostridia bacterium]|nr:response regulator transcription factor [Clostridia bacterium]
MSKIKVAIVEDDPQWVLLMSEFIDLQEDMTVLWTANNREDAVRLSGEHKTDIIIMDINLSEDHCDGIYAALEILEKGKGSKIIMLTSLKDEGIIRSAFDAGAVNYITKDNYRYISQAIRSAYSNKSPIETVLKEYLRLKQREYIEDLTAAEKEIYDLIEKGCSRGEIERITQKSKNTIKSQLKSIYLKLGVSRSKEVMDKVKQRKFLSLFRNIK